MHIMMNLIIQIFLGVALELVHHWWRVALVYLAGVAAGSMGTSIVNPHIFLAGASGGVYALITAHIATIIMVRWIHHRHYRRIAGARTNRNCTESPNIFNFAELERNGIRNRSIVRIFDILRNGSRLVGVSDRERCARPSRLCGASIGCRGRTARRHRSAAEFESSLLGTRALVVCGFIVLHADGERHRHPHILQRPFLPPTIVQRTIPIKCKWSGNGKSRALQRHQRRFIWQYDTFMQN